MFILSSVSHRDISLFFQRILSKEIKRFPRYDGDDTNMISTEKSFP